MDWDGMRCIRKIKNNNRLKSFQLNRGVNNMIFENKVKIINNVVGSVSRTIIERNLDAFIKYLNLPSRKIRLFVDNGDNYGNQSASVNILRRFINPKTADNLNYGYKGTIEVYYENGSDSNGVRVIDKLYELLPEMVDAGIKLGTKIIHDATVTLLPYDNKSPPIEVLEFGLTGATDTSIENYAKKLNVRCFLQLQPYNYSFAQKIYLINGEKGVNLNEVKELKSFKQRLFYVPETTYNNPIRNIGDVKSDILQYLTNTDLLKKYRLVVSYVAMDTQMINGTPEYVPTILAGSMLQLQKSGAKNSEFPIIILNTNKYGEPDKDKLANVKDLLAGGLTDHEKVIFLKNRNPNFHQVEQTAKNRATYMKTLNSSERFRYCNYPKTLEEVKEKVEVTIVKKSVLFIQLGRIPEPLFYYAQFKSNLINLFEGANSLNGAFNIGKPLLAISRFHQKVEPSVYPHVTHSLFSSSPPINEFIIAGQQLSFTLDNWESNVKDNPCYKLGSFMGKVFSQVSPDDPIPKYFREIKELYSESFEDKLNVALAYLMYLYNPFYPKQIIRQSTAFATIETDENPLNALYKELQEKVTIGKKLNLIPGVIAKGNINTVILAILKEYSEALWMTVDLFEKEGNEPNIIKITIDGTTDVFNGQGSTNAIKVLFDAPDNQIRCTVSFESEGTWSLAGVPWIQMSTPFLKITVSDGQLPVIASIGGKYAPLDANLSLLMPSATDQYLVTVDFDPKYPSIDKVFQMAAGIDLVNILPPPFNILSDLGVEKVELIYDYEKQDVPSLGLIVKNNRTDPLPLVDKVALENIEIQIGVIQPKTSRTIDVTASGEFVIGSGDNKGVITTSISYPDLIFQGSLTSGEVKFEDLLATFLPSDVILQLPKLPTITQFDFSYNKQSDTMSVSVLLDVDWVFKLPGAGTITLNNVGFFISRETKQNTGYVIGNTTIDLSGEKDPLQLIIGAYYQGNGCWLFSAKQSEGVIDINDLLVYCLGNSWKSTGITFPKINGLEIDLEWNRNGSLEDWRFTAKTAEPWKITPLNLSISANVTLLSNGGSQTIGHPVRRIGKAEMPVLIIDEATQHLPVLVTTENRSDPQGMISAEIKWNNIDLLVSYNFDPKVICFEVKWGIFSGEIKDVKINGETHYIATIHFTPSTTLGSMIETMVSWATNSKFGLCAPWNVLDKIPLSNFELEWDFTAETVKFKVNIGPIDLGFATINSIDIRYDKDPKPDPNLKSGKEPAKRVMVELDASFVWGEKIPAWDATKPEDTPSAGGSGNKYLDLRLLAMGQHVKLKLEDPKTGTGQADPNKVTVQDVIKYMENLPEPKKDEIPAITFDANSSWLFGADFGVLRIDPKKGVNIQNALVPAGKLEEDSSKYVLTLQTVFNDPYLYALRIALDGDAAKVFKGLDFQIMYRKLSDSIGVYSAEIVLPDAMRYLTIGAYSITLPVFAIDIYSTGDFKVDLGFPWNENFTRSFSIEAIIPPGIPMIGSGGVYFGKIPQVAAKNLPVTTRGHFNPILVLGFGAQLGLGKTIEYGVLKAGISLTIFGILEGMLAKWNPYENKVLIDSLPDSGSLQLQGEYYFWMQGTLGIYGKVFGSVDFAVIKADVDITIMIYAQITFAAYKPIPITIVASLDATASLTINLGLFKIHLHFSFSVKIKETLTIGALQNPNDAPWAEGNGQGLLAGPLHCRLRAHRLALTAMNGNEIISPEWSRLSKPEAPVALNGYLSFALTVAGDRAFDGGDPVPCYIASMFIDSVQAAKENDFTSMKKAEGLGEEKDTSFETLAKLVARWAIASIQTEDVTPDKVDTLVVTDNELMSLLEYLNDLKRPIPIPADSIEAFLSHQIQMTVSMPKDQREAFAAFFPMPLPLTLERSAYGGFPALSYSFEDYNAIDNDFVSWLRTYFDQLAVQVQKESGDKENAVLLEGEQGDTSVGSFLFTDYFTLIMRQMLRALRDGLRDFKRPIKPDDTGNEIVTWVNGTGNITNKECEFALYDLFEGNANHKLNKGCELTLPSVTYTVQTDDTFEKIATRDEFKKSFDAAKLAEQNANTTDLLIAGQIITYPSKDDYTVNGSVSLNAIAQVFNVNLKNLLDNSNILKGNNLLKPFALISLPPFSYTTTKDDETLSSVASAHSITIKDLVTNVNGNIKNMFSKSDPYIDLVHLPQFQVSELIKEAQRSKALEHLSGMVSRYYFHGLRLPTLDKGEIKIRPKQEGGIWVTRDETGLHLPAAAGLFALTGQQLLIPQLGPDPLTISVTRPNSGLDWLQFIEGNHDVKTLSVSIKPPALGNAKSAPTDDDYLRIEALRKFATQDLLDKELQSIGPQCMIDSKTSAYPLSSSIPWQSSTKTTYPSSRGAFDGERPRLWYLPRAMLSLPHSDAPGTDPCPCFDLKTHHYNEATGATDQSPLNYYGWATAIEFTIKRLPEIPVEEAVKKTCAYNNTYEIMGAGGQEVVLLERIVQSVKDSEVSQLVLGYRLNSEKDAVLRAETDSRITMGISQVNLSTVTRPPSSARDLLCAEEMEKANLLNKQLEFVQLLWEASITRAGGFYLYYFDTKIDAGLPDLIFNDKDETTVTLIVIYKPEQKDRLCSYMNSVLIGDPIDVSTNAVVAQTNSLPVSHGVKIGESLNSIATRYYSNVLCLVQKNPEMSFSKDATFTLVNGTYLVSTSSPGGKLADIANYFKMDETEIKKANPRVKDSQWTNGLKEGTPIRLPKSKRTVGVDPGGVTLQSLADYYSSSHAAIAGENQFEVGLLSIEQSLNIYTGPFVQAASTLPDVQAIGVTRNSLPEVPPEGPTSTDYAKNYLLNLYTILGVSVDGNQDFIESNIGLPLGPQGKPASDHMDKIRAAKPMNDEDPLIYSKSILYSKLLSDGNGKPSTEVKPYQSNGRLLQIDYSWYDLFGNRLITQIDQKPENGINTKEPILAGYTDKLIGLSQWPSTSAHWTVAASDNPDSFLLTMNIIFDSLPFKKPDESESNCWQIQTQTEEKEPKPWQIRAHTALATYDLLLDQLNDPNGINLQFETSLLNEPVPVPLDQTGLGSLLDKSTKIRDYLKSCCDWTGGPDPNPSSISNCCITLQAEAKKSDLNKTQLFKLDFQFIIERIKGVAEGDFAAVPAVKRIATPVTPITTVKNNENLVYGANTDKPGLDGFAKSIENTLSLPGKYILTVATGVDRFEADAGGSAAALWIVRLGVNSDQGISYSIIDQSKPQIFAPRPISNKLISRKVPICDYTSLDDFDPTNNEFTKTPQELTFTDIELDKWVRQLFNDIDDLLSPEYVSSILVIDQYMRKHPELRISTFLDKFNDQKDKLAKIAKELMSPVYEKQETTRLDSAKESLYQELLVKLSNLYSIRAAVSFGANVKADISKASSDSENPQLFGNIVWANTGSAHSQITLTSPKLALNTNSDAPLPLTFLVEAPAQTKSSHLTLDLRFNGTSIEHQISSVPGIDKDYKASSWLDFVRTETVEKLQVGLGNFEIPMFERSFPLSPRMDVQTGKATPKEKEANLEANLSDLTLWDYTFTYSQDFHYTQDIIHGKVEYNLYDNKNMLRADFYNAFQALAQFASSRPTLEKLLKENIPRIDATTCNQTEVDNAAKVLGAFLKMVIDVVKQVGSSGCFNFKAQLPALRGDDNSYMFYIKEGHKEISQKEEAEPSEWIVKIVSKDLNPPANLKSYPYVHIDGYNPQLESTPKELKQGIYSYRYEDKSDSHKYLTAFQAQVIPKRTMVMPGMQILKYQDAKSTVSIKRNEELVEGFPSDDRFIYQTPEVTFSNPLQPTITSDHPVNIVELGENPWEKDPYRSILKLLFNEELFKGFTGEVIIQTEVIYNLALINGVSDLLVPNSILLQPPLNVSKGNSSMEDMISQLTEGINYWLTENNPVQNNASLKIRLSIMSNLTRQRIPLVTLTNLFLSMGDIEN